MRPARWSCSRATTRSSPTASGSRSTRSPAPALATAGTGDVLSGMTAALLARGLEPFAAACAAVLAHARAGRDAAARIGAAESVIATDVIDSIPAGMRPDGAGRIISQPDEDRRGHHGLATCPSVSPDDDARTAIDLLAKTDLGAIPVVDEDRTVVGIVSESDLVLSDEESDLHLPHYLNIMGGIVFVGSMKGFEERLDKAFATKVSELMTADPVVANDYEGADRVAKKIADKHHNHLPVVDADGRLAGWSRGPTRSPRSSTTLAMERAVARIDFDAVRANCARLKAELGERPSSARWSRPTATATAPTAAPRRRWRGRDAAGGGDRRRGRAVGRRFPHIPLLTMGALSAEEVDIVARGRLRGGGLARGLPSPRSPTAPVPRAARPGSTSSTTAAWAGSATPTRPRCWRWRAPAPRTPASSWPASGPTSRPPTNRTPASSTSSSSASSAVAAAVKAEFPAVLAHAANSAAVFRDARSHFDMARCGVAIYGLDPFQGDPAERGLVPALSLRSYVADVKRFEPGASAGYGQTWRGDGDDLRSA